jgi:hypothetical protein
MQYSIVKSTEKLMLRAMSQRGEGLSKLWEGQDHLPNGFAKIHLGI